MDEIRLSYLVYKGGKLELATKKPGNLTGSDWNVLQTCADDVIISQGRYRKVPTHADNDPPVFYVLYKKINPDTPIDI